MWVYVHVCEYICIYAWVHVHVCECMCMPEISFGCRSSGAIRFDFVCCLSVFGDWVSLLSWSSPCRLGITNVCHHVCIFKMWVLRTPIESSCLGGKRCTDWAIPCLLLVLWLGWLLLLSSDKASCMRIIWGGESHTCEVAGHGLEPLVLQPPPLECWEKRLVPPCLVSGGAGGLNPGLDVHSKCSQFIPCYITSFIKLTCKCTLPPTSAGWILHYWGTKVSSLAECHRFLFALRLLKKKKSEKKSIISLHIQGTSNLELINEAHVSSVLFCVNL